MNVLTHDIISLIATRNFQIIKHNSHRMVVSYIDQNGHRINGPAYILYGDSWYWYLHGKRHRTDQTKPAFKMGNHYIWYNMGKFIAKRKK